jgi:hypothetical protein
MTVQQLITAALRKISVVASGEDPTANELADGLSALQSMLRSWAAEKINIFASVKESFTLTVGTYLYTWGTAGSINTARPNSVLGVYILDSAGVSHNVDIISENKYRLISIKATTGRPYALFAHMTYPLVNIYLYPVPDTAEVMYLDSMKPFTEASSFSAQTDTISFPPEYEEVLIYNLAIRSAPEFGKTIPVEVAAVASRSYERLTRLNLANTIEPVIISLPVGRSQGSHYSINSDTYR